MKIAITGHTAGLGKSLFEYFSKNHECVGFSTSNGYDITTTYDDIVKQIADVDVFFNNTWVGQTQSNFIIDCQKYKNLKMIVSGSTTTDFPEQANRSLKYTQYFQDKTHVENTFKQYSRFYRHRCLFLKLGYLENRMKGAIGVINHPSEHHHLIQHSTIINLINFWFTDTSFSTIVWPSIPK
jgi:hypothetical protein